ncbi:hypothetical protein HPB51_013699 [Rhipicephalus microplus]|uniref:Uncharacterized protein n=1 Tax=Rhipicephalus microplus TaxID=6941 RepID=A0A9J6F3F2_RHIMP|nr:hypothetical protein HPB51_013699 [Rhipicephalus microplus]
MKITEVNVSYLSKNVTPNSSFRAIGSQVYRASLQTFTSKLASWLRRCSDRSKKSDLQTRSVAVGRPVRSGGRFVRLLDRTASVEVVAAHLDRCGRRRQMERDAPLAAGCFSCSPSQSRPLAVKTDLESTRARSAQSAADSRQSRAAFNPTYQGASADSTRLLVMMMMMLCTAGAGC